MPQLSTVWLKARLTLTWPKVNEYLQRLKITFTIKISLMLITNLGYRIPMFLSNSRKDKLNVCNNQPEGQKCLWEVLNFLSVLLHQSLFVNKKIEGYLPAQKIWLKSQINTFLSQQPLRDWTDAVHVNQQIFTNIHTLNRNKPTEISKEKVKFHKLANLYKPFNIIKKRKLKHLICRIVNWAILKSFILYKKLQKLEKSSI